MRYTTITAEERHKFEVGKDYWTYFMETTNKGNALRNVIKVFKTKLIKKQPSEYEAGGIYLRFHVPDTLKEKLSSTMNHNLPIYMNGYGMAQCEFFDTEEEAMKGFDKRIEDIAKGQKATDRDKMLAKRYNNNKLKVTSLESSAKEWRENLSKKEKSYLQWFLENE